MVALIQIKENWKFIIMKYSWLLNNMGLGVPTFQAVENFTIIYSWSSVPTVPLYSHGSFVYMILKLNLTNWELCSTVEFTI